MAPKAEKKSRILNESSEMVAIDAIRPHPQNPREGDIGAIVESIRENGFFGACIVQKSTGFILVGNHRYKAAQMLGFTEVPVIFVDVDDERALRILLVDNRTNDLATYNDADLSALLQKIMTETGTLTGTGYSGDDLDELIEKINGMPRNLEDGSLVDLAKVAIGEPTYKVEHGEVWELGNHLLICSEVLDEVHLWLPLLSKDMVFLPYPGPFVTFTEKARARKMLLVQPDEYIAGHILDRHARIYPDQVRKK